MDLSVVNSENKKIEVPDSIFNCRFNKALIHQVVTAFLSGARAGTHAQKTRSEVRGGGAKPFRQKGTGRARAGTIRSPLWRKGGVVFAAKPRNYEQKVNKKMYRGALRSIFSELIRENKLMLVDSFEMNTCKTKDLLKKLNQFDLYEKILIITEAIEENLYLSARNVPTIEVRDVPAVDPVCLMGKEKVLITVPALKQIEELLR